jgi:hypothetical protein
MILTKVNHELLPHSCVYFHVTNITLYRFTHCSNIHIYFYLEGGGGIAIPDIQANPSWDHGFM